VFWPEAMDIIVANGAKAKGVIVAVDRQEKGKGDISAIQEIEKNCVLTSLRLKL
jgi:orotate phosphoribosyltransferase